MVLLCWSFSWIWFYVHCWFNNGFGGLDVFLIWNEILICFMGCFIFIFLLERTSASASSSSDLLNLWYLLVLLSLGWDNCWGGLGGKIYPIWRWRQFFFSSLCFIHHLGIYLFNYFIWTRYFKNEVDLDEYFIFIFIITFSLDNNF